MFRFGVDYYPEQWSPQRWKTDASLMAQAGVNVVRLAEFAWSLLEPIPGHFDFAWLDEAIAVLHSHHIDVILGTPTASPPPWVMDMMPDAYKVNHSGQRLTYGNRCEFCPTHTGYQQRAKIIATAMAQHYAAHPAVIGWQIDNELGGRCYCPSCQSAFQQWLQTRYQSLENLNAAWGTTFWSHVYTHWAQIPLPLETGGAPNPGLELDYYRFISDAFVNFQQIQVDLIRAACPSHFITHNFMGFGFDHINYFDLAKTLDFISFDNYPRTGWSLAREVNPAYLALGLDASRGYKAKPFWVMEQQSGSGGWQTLGVSPFPGEIRLWTYQAIAHGADAIIYFRWRTARYGTEQFWHGVLDHHGQPGRRYAEIKTIGTELNRIGNLLAGSENRNRVAMILSSDSRWAFLGQPNHPEWKYNNFFSTLYTALNRRGIGVDIISPDADLSSYQLVIAPALYVLPPRVAENLHQFVAAGGMLITTARSGVKGSSNEVIDQKLPGLLTDVCGVEVEEYSLLPADHPIPLELTLPGLPPKQSQAQAWFDLLQPTSAQVLARYCDEDFAPYPAITLNEFGKGQCIYIGTLGNDSLLDSIIQWALQTKGITAATTPPSGVEVVERWQGNQAYLFILNHTSKEQQIILTGTFLDIINGSVVQTPLIIPPREVLILQTHQLVSKPIQPLSM